MHIINLEDAAGMVATMGVPVHGAPAVGLPLHTNGKLGADILHVPAGKHFPVHTHPGDHLLLCLVGEGTISVGRQTYSVVPGDFYMVDGLTPHAVGAASDKDHILVAIGSPHKAVDAPDRMEFTDWQGNQVREPILATDTPQLMMAPPREFTHEFSDLRASLEEFTTKHPAIWRAQAVGE